MNELGVGTSNARQRIEYNGAGNDGYGEEERKPKPWEVGPTGAAPPWQRSGDNSDAGSSAPPWLAAPKAEGSYDQGGYNAAPWNAAPPPPPGGAAYGSNYGYGNYSSYAQYDTNYATAGAPGYSTLR